MKISIKGYKNIEELDYFIQDKKLNVLIGITGSGKSAIAEALLKQDIEFNKKINFTDSVVSDIDGREPSSINVFNDMTVERYLFSEERNSNVYSILIDDENVMIKAREALDNRLKSIRAQIEAYEPDYNELKAIQNQLGASLTSTNKIKVTCAINKMKTSLKSLENKRLYQSISKLDEKQVEWIKNGVKFIDDSKCPFCDKVLSKYREKKLRNYVHLDLENKRKMNLSDDQLKKLKTSALSLTINGLSKLEEDMIKIGIALKEYEKLGNTLLYLNEPNVDINKIDLSFKEELYVVFPMLKNEIKSLNKKINQLKTNVLNAQINTKRVLAYKLNQINGIIETFGIPYKIEATYKYPKITEYKLYHIEDLQKENREKGLSSGEKKIIALIFFILENSKLNPDLIILDDPVSSYDDNRRLSIFNFILQHLNNKTVLILSHDQVFARFAALKNSKKIGNIDYFDNFGKVKIVGISKMDFADLREVIKYRIKSSLNYIQKIINLRFYYDITAHNTEYRYLSKIIHKDDVNNWLNTSKIKEEDIVNNLKSNFSIDLELFSTNFYENISTTEFSLLEKMFLLRESNVSKKIRDELSNHIHLNSKYIVSLNPYKFSFCSSYVYKVISEEIADCYTM